MQERFPGVYVDGDDIFTRNRVPGRTVYGEQTRMHRGTEYRRWSKHRSKAAAALTKGLNEFPVNPGDDMVYLGASTGTTVSHFSDVLRDGMIYAVEYGSAVIRSLVSLSEHRDNIAPLLGDARKPQEYAPFCAQVDIIYQDVAQKDQAMMLRKNADMFLKDGGHAMIAIKAQSISSTENPETVFDGVKDELNEDFEILAGKKLTPFHTDHLFLVLEKQ